MKLFNKKRAAAIGAAGALAMGTVVSGGLVAPAQAAGTSYDCTTTGGALTFPVTASNPFQGVYEPGQSVASKPMSMNVQVVDSVLGIIKLLVPGITEISGTLSNGALGVGGQSVALQDMTIPSTPVPATGGMSLVASGTTAPFTAPSTPGSYPVTFPSGFDFQPSFFPTPIPCATTPNASTALGTMSVKYASTTRARLTNAPITTSERPKVATRVLLTESGDPAAGRVVAKEGGKVLAKGTLNDAGKKTLVLPKLKRGAHKVVVKYKGSSTTKASQKVLSFTVRRG